MLSLLYVDDEEDLRDLAEFALGLDEEIGVVTAESGEVALAKLRAGTFEAVLLDVMMPGMDGQAVLLAIQASDSLAKLPVIIVTARAMPEECKIWRALGAKGVITKPYDPMTLAADVRRILST